MIGYLRGKIQQVFRESFILDVGGVGYELLASSKLLQRLTKDEEAEFYIYTHVREDQLKLFAFEEVLEKEMFEATISVSGVGPKIGLAILGGGTVSEIKKAISKADVEFFTKIKGLGKKGSQKIIIELKNKLGSVNELDLSDGAGDEAVSEVMEALLSLGFMRRDVLRILPEIDTNLPENEQIRVGLQLLGK